MTRYGARRRRDVTTAIGAGLVLAAVVVATGQHHAADAAAVSPAQLSAAGHGGTLSCRGLEALWESAGGSPRAAFTAAEIAMAESGGRQYATDLNGGASTDRGYWQINSVHGSLSTYDAAGNARAAVQISSNGTDWSPWVTYQTGAYQGRC